MIFCINKVCWNITYLYLKLTLTQLWYIFMHIQGCKFLPMVLREAAKKLFLMVREGAGKALVAGPLKRNFLRLPLYYMVAHRTCWVQSVIWSVQGICSNQQQSQFEIILIETFFLDEWATCSELPSDISTMFRPQTQINPNSIGCGGDTLCDAKFNE